MARPAWANGPEWEGWRVMDDGSLMIANQHGECYFHPSSVMLEVFAKSIQMTSALPFKSPELARLAAVALMEGLA